MEYTQITQQITQFPEAPDSANDTPTEFNTKADAFVNHQANVYVDEVNNWATQANTLRDEINDTVSTLPDGVINDDIVSETDAWSSSKISSIQPEEGANYIKFNDGTLIVHGKATLEQDGSFTHVAKVVVDFPIEFTSEPAVTMVLTEIPDSADAREKCQAVATPSTTSVVLGYYSTNGDISSLFGSVVSYQAIGRWK